MNIEQLGMYAPYICVAVAFLSTYKIFVTPDMLDKRLEKYVLKETHDIAINGIKTDVDEIKKTLDKIYEKLING